MRVVRINKKDKCVKCGELKDNKKYGEIWLSEDGYCSVCNVEYKDRERISPFFNFKYDISKGYVHYNSQGEKRTNKNIVNREKMLKIKGCKATTRAYLYHQYKENQNKKIEEWT